MRTSLFLFALPLALSSSAVAVAQRERFEDTVTPDQLAPAFIDGPALSPGATGSNAATEEPAASDSEAEADSTPPPANFLENRRGPNPVRLEAAGSSDEPRRLKAPPANAKP